MVSVTVSSKPFSPDTWLSTPSTVTVNAFRAVDEYDVGWSRSLLNVSTMLRPFVETSASVR